MKQTFKQLKQFIREELVSKIDLRHPGRHQHDVDDENVIDDIETGTNRDSIKDYPIRRIGTGGPNNVRR